MESANQSPRNNGQIWILVSLSLLGYILLAIWFPLRPYFDNRPSPDISSLAPSVAEALAYAALICVLFGFYWLAYRKTRTLSRALPLTTVIFSAALFCMPLIITFPVNATDVYRYFIRGRITTVHERNPYTVPVADLPDEPYADLAGEWGEATTPYGPLWEISAALLTSVSPDNLRIGLLSFKGIAALFHLIIAVMIWHSLPGTTPARRSSIALLWAWNPALLLMFAMNGHNDSLMILWLVLGWLLLTRNRRYLGLTVLMLAPLTKPIAILPLPFIFLSCWRQMANIKSRILFPAFALTIGFVLTWLAFLPFGSPLSLVERLLGEAGTGGGFSTSALIILQMRAWGQDPSITLLNQIGAMVLGLLAIWLLWFTWRGRTPLRASADIFAGYIVQAFRFRIWYAAWPFPWLLLDSGNKEADSVSARARLAAGVTFLLTSQLSVVVYGQIRTGLLAGSQLAAHFIGITLTFVVPLLIGFAVAVSGGRLRERQIERSDH